MRITAGEFHAADGVGDWRSLYHFVSAHLRNRSPAEGVPLVEAIGRVAGEVDHLSVDLRARGVTVSMGVRDVELARRISEAAEGLGIAADPTAVQVVNVTLDAVVGADVLPFWRVVLGYGQIGDDYLFDPLRRGPGFGFQGVGVARPGGKRVHLGVAVPPDQGKGRGGAAPAAGGGVGVSGPAPTGGGVAGAA